MCVRVCLCARACVHSCSFNKPTHKQHRTCSVPGSPADNSSYYDNLRCGRCNWPVLRPLRRPCVIKHTASQRESHSTAVAACCCCCWRGCSTLSSRETQAQFTGSKRSVLQHRVSSIDTLHSRLFYSDVFDSRKGSVVIPSPPVICSTVESVPLYE